MRFCMPQRGYHSRRIIVDTIKKYSDAALPELSGRGVGCLGMVSNCTKRNVFRLLSIIGFASLVAQGVRLVAGGDVDGWEIVPADGLHCILRDVAQVFARGKARLFLWLGAAPLANVEGLLIRAGTRLSGKLSRNPPSADTPLNRPLKKAEDAPCGLPLLYFR